MTVRNIGAVYGIPIASRTRRDTVSVPRIVPKKSEYAGPCEVGVRGTLLSPVSRYFFWDGDSQVPWHYLGGLHHSTRAVLDSLGHMSRPQDIAPCQIGNRAGQLQGAMEGTGAEMELVYRGFDQ